MTNFSEVFADFSIYDNDDEVCKKVDEYQINVHATEYKYSKYHTVSNNHVCTSETDFDVTSNLNDLDINKLVKLKSYLNTVVCDTIAYRRQIDKLIVTVELQILKLIVILSTVKNSIISIFVPTSNEFNLSFIRINLLHQQTYYRYKTHSNTY